MWSDLHVSYTCVRWKLEKAKKLFWLFFLFSFSALPHSLTLCLCVCALRESAAVCECDCRPTTTLMRWKKSLVQCWDYLYIILFLNTLLEGIKYKIVVGLHNITILDHHRIILLYLWASCLCPTCVPFTISQLATKMSSVGATSHNIVLRSSNCRYNMMYPS